MPGKQKMLERSKNRGRCSTWVITTEKHSLIPGSLREREGTIGCWEGPRQDPRGFSAPAPTAQPGPGDSGAHLQLFAGPGQDSSLLQ